MSRKRRLGQRRVVAAAVVLAALIASSPSGRVERSSVALRSEARDGSTVGFSVDAVRTLASHAVAPPSLLSLADGRRLSGDLDEARRAYVALRSSFQNSVEAGHATFWLGEMKFSNEKDYADAALWFDTYLREQPRGAFAARAQARLMESLYRIADWGGAVRLANAYLAEHPNGPDSELALAILNDQALP